MVDHTKINSRPACALQPVNDQRFYGHLTRNDLQTQILFDSRIEHVRGEGVIGLRRVNRPRHVEIVGFRQSGLVNDLAKSFLAEPHKDLPDSDAPSSEFDFFSGTTPLHAGGMAGRTLRRSTGVELKGAEQAAS